MKIFLFTVALLWGAGGLDARAKTYRFDSEHCLVGFSIKHWDFITKTGHFDVYEGRIHYDDKNIEKSSVEVTIEAHSIDTHNEKRDKHLREAGFFDVASYPTLVFKSTKVSAGKKPGTLEIAGNLTMRGVTRPVILAARINGALVDDATGKERLAFEASTMINRKDYGIAWNEVNKAGNFKVGDEVEIIINGATSKK